MEECRTEASIGVEYSESIHGSSEDENTNSASIKTPAQAEGCSPSQRRKRKRISPHSTPKVADGKVQNATAKNKSMQTLLHMYISVLNKSYICLRYATRKNLRCCSLIFVYVCGNVCIRPVFK